MVSIKRVLVVDDEPGVRALLSEILAGPELHVTLAGDGLEAVQLLRRRRYDAVVTDVNMPGMDGIDLLRWMKRNKRREKAVVMSGSPRHDLLPAPELPPIRARFRKPFRIGMFVTIMEAVLFDRRGNPGRRAGTGRKGVA
ncbi:MAG: response regulator [Deltaproteobacteria bacterium]|nr:response regulator [Deltaproteobacteria bacterium]